MAKSKKVSKWDAAPKSIKKLHEAFAAFSTMNYAELDDKADWDELNELLEQALNDYNELEAKHNSDCGLISTLEADNDDLECELGKYKTIIKDLRHENEELETELNEKKNVINEVEGKFKTLMDYLRDEWRFKVDYRPDIGTHNWRWHLKQVGPNQYNHNSNNFRYAFKEACRYIGMTPGQIADEVRWVRLSDTTECDIINRWKRMSEWKRLREHANMGKNNDIKMSLEAAPKNMGTLFTYIDLVIGMACSLPPEIHDNLYDLMGKTLDEYSELVKYKAKNDKFSSHYGLGDCHNCKNFDPKE